MFSINTRGTRDEKPYSVLSTGGLSGYYNIYPKFGSRNRFISISVFRPFPLDDSNYFAVYNYWGFEKFFCVINLVFLNFLFTCFHKDCYSSTLYNMLDLTRVPDSELKIRPCAHVDNTIQHWFYYISYYHQLFFFWIFYLFTVILSYHDSRFIECLEFKMLKYLHFDNAIL